MDMPVVYHRDTHRDTWVGTHNGRVKELAMTVFDVRPVNHLRKNIGGRGVVQDCLGRKSVFFAPRPGAISTRYARFSNLVAVCEKIDALVERESFGTCFRKKKL